MNLLTRLTHGVFWTVLGASGARLLSLAVAAALARLLAQEAFGELGMLQSTLGLFGVLAGFSLGLTVTKHLAELRFRDPRRCGRLIALSQLAALTTGSLMTLVNLAAAPWLADIFLQAPHLAAILQLGSPLLLVSALLGVYTGCLSGFQAFRAIARLHLCQGLITVPLTLIFVYAGGLAGAMLSLVFSALAGLGLAALALRRECRAAGISLDYRGSWEERRTLWDFSFPAVITGCWASLVTWAVFALLARQPGGYAQLGLFTAAAKLQALLLFVPNTVALVTGPLLAEIHGKHDPGRFARAVNLNLKATWSLALPAGFLLIGAGPWLMGIFGSAFQQERLVPALLITAAVLNLANNTLGQTLLSSGRMWAGLVIYLAWGLILLTTAWLLVPTLGAAGLAMAYFLAYGGHTFWALIYSRVHFGRASIAHSHGLAALTGILFLLALSVGRLHMISVVLLSLVGGALTLAWSWRLLAADGRRHLLSVAGIKA